MSILKDSCHSVSNDSLYQKRFFCMKFMKNNFVKGKENLYINVQKFTKVLQNIFHGDKKTSCFKELFVTLANTAES